MKRITALGFLLLSACAGNTAGPVDGPKYLAAQPGPSVTGVEASLLSSARTAENAEDFAAAAGYYQQLADKAPENSEYRLALAESLRRAGEADRALTEYGAVLAKDPSLAAAQEGEALALMEKGDAAGAERMFSQLRAAGKAGWRTYNALGVLMAAHDPANALPFFDEALRASPDNPSVLNNKGLALALNHQFPEAATTLARAAQLAAQPALHERIELNDALVYAAAGHLDEAHTLAARYFSGAALNNNLAFYAHLAHDDALARAYLDMALSESKTFYQRAWNNEQALKAAP